MLSLFWKLNIRIGFFIFPSLLVVGFLLHFLKASIFITLLFLMFYRSFFDSVIKNKDVAITYIVSNPTYRRLIYCQNICFSLLLNMAFIFSKLLALTISFVILFIGQKLPYNINIYEIAFNISDYVAFNIQVFGLITFGNFIGNSDLLTLGRGVYILISFTLSLLILFCFILLLLVLNKLFYWAILSIIVLIFWYISLKVNPTISHIAYRLR
jgi:hypothetical protein